MPKVELERRYYFDSNVFCDLIDLPEDDEKSKTIAAMIADAKKGRFEIVTSVLTITEVWVSQQEINRKAIDPDVERKINLLWHPKSSPIRIVEVHDLIARDAMRLLRTFLHKGWAKTRSADAIHLVTAQREGVHEFITTENSARKWGPVVGFKVCAAHYDPPNPEHGPLFEDMKSTEPLPSETIAADNDPYWLMRMSKTRQLAARDPNRFGHRRPLRK